MFVMLSIEIPFGSSQKYGRLRIFISGDIDIYQLVYAHIAFGINHDHLSL
jgi:hypothetical protein